MEDLKISDLKISDWRVMADTMMSDIGIGDLSLFTRPGYLNSYFPVAENKTAMLTVYNTGGKQYYKNKHL